MKALILGGVKSGKSRYAEQLAVQQGQAAQLPVTLIATAKALDQEMAERIARHQAERSPNWQTLEAPYYLGDAILQTETGHVVVVDCLTLWLTNLLMAGDEALLQAELQAFEQAVIHCSGPLILVSNETNMGVVPVGEISRRYCDEIGLLHQRLARCCDRVTLVVAGLPVELKATI